MPHNTHHITNHYTYSTEPKCCECPNYSTTVRNVTTDHIHPHTALTQYQMITWCSSSYKYFSILHGLPVTDVLIVPSDSIIVLDCANFELTNHNAYRVENKSLISTPRKLISTTGKLIFQVCEYTRLPLEVAGGRGNDAWNTRYGREAGQERVQVLRCRSLLPTMPYVGLRRSQQCPLVMLACCQHERTNVALRRLFRCRRRLSSLLATALNSKSCCYGRLLLSNV